MVEMKIKTLSIPVTQKTLIFVLFLIDCMYQSFQSLKTSYWYTELIIAGYVMYWFYVKNLSKENKKRLYNIVDKVLSIYISFVPVGHDKLAGCK